MTPTNSGRHCSSCAKTVIDFTAMSNDEILGYLSQRKDERVCGRFKGEQVIQPVIVTARYLSSRRWSVTQAIRLAIFIVFSSSLFSCTNAQTGKKEKTQIVIEGQSEGNYQEDVILGKAERQAPPPPAIGASCVKGEAIMMGDISLPPPVEPVIPQPLPDTIHKTIMKGQVSIPDSVIEANGDFLGKPAFISAEKMTEPIYPGGESELNYFMRTNLRYPQMEHENMIQGTMNVRFTISEKGDVINCEVLNTIPGSKNFESEIKRVSGKMPAWKPATKNGKDVEGFYVLPVRFRLGD